MNKANRDYFWARVWWAAGYFVIPICVFIIAAYRKPCGESPLTGACGWWRFTFCFLAGCWGLAVRAFHLREEFRASSSPWPDYATVYPITLIMNAAAVFTVLSLFKQLEGVLFYTAALPLAMVLGVHCHPAQWILSRLISRGWPEVKT